MFSNAVMYVKRTMQRNFIVYEQQFTDNILYAWNASEDFVSSIHLALP